MTHQTKDKDFTPKNPLLSTDHYIIPAFSLLQPLWKLYRTEDSHFRESHNFSHGFLQPRSKTSSLKEPMSTSSAPYRQTTASWNAQYFVDFSTVSATTWLRDLRKGQKRGGKRRGTELDCKKRKMKTKESAEHLQEHPGYFQCAPLAPENRLRFSLCSENGSSFLALLLLCQFKLLSAACNWTNLSAFWVMEPEPHVIFSAYSDTIQSTPHHTPSSGNRARGSIKLLE